MSERVGGYCWVAIMISHCHVTLGILFSCYGHFSSGSFISRVVAINSGGQKIKAWRVTSSYPTLIREISMTGSLRSLHESHFTLMQR